MAYNSLVVNGCSYMEAYANGGGHDHLAELLGISDSSSLAIGGSANTRILRTTLKHSYQATQPTFYVLGLTFLSRLEIPILENQGEFEGRWTNPQNQQFSAHWQYGWTQKDTDQFIEIKLKSEFSSILDRLEDLMYRLLSTVADLRARGHQVIMFQQADDIIQNFLKDPRVDLLKSIPNIVEGLSWLSIPWQHEHGVPSMYDDCHIYHVPENMRHRAAGQHHKLNEFLANYIKVNGLHNC